MNSSDNIVTDNVLTFFKALLGCVPNRFWKVKEMNRMWRVQPEVPCDGSFSDSSAVLNIL